MSAEIIPFDFEANAVRVVMIEDAPWWVAADVCRVLEISNTRDALSRLDEDERDGVGITDAIGRSQTMNVINESGFYKLVLTSRKPAAKRFTKWVTAEVLPALRTRGRYEMPRQAVDPFAANAARVAHVADHLSGLAGLEELVLRITHLPIWRNGRRPPWWSDMEVRTFLTASHRQMSILECEAEGHRRFGQRCPKKSAIHSYWQRIDTALGPVSPVRVRERRAS